MVRGSYTHNMFLFLIVCCLAYGGWQFKQHYDLMHETIQIQDQAISMLKLENYMLKMRQPVVRPTTPWYQQQNDQSPIH